MSSRVQRIIEEQFGRGGASVEFSRPDPKFGDYAINVALQLAGPLGKNPREIAEQIAEKLRGEADFAEVSVAGSIIDRKSVV